MSEWTSGGTSVTFEEIGDRVAGTIVFATIEDGTDMKGNPDRKRILDIEEEDGETRRLYVKKGVMTAELGKSLKAVGREAPQPGDRIAVVFESTRPSSKPGFNPIKVYSVAYKVGAPAAAGNVQSTSAADLI